MITHYLLWGEPLSLSGHTMASKKEAGRDSLPKYGEFISGENDSMISKIF